MPDETRIQITCSACKAVLNAKAELAGKRAKCPKCGASVEIPTPSAPEPEKRVRLATERQKEYARSLGIVFREDISRTEISRQIDEAVTKRDDERFARLHELSRRESEARKQMREEVLAELDEEDCRLSRAEPSQMIEALSERGLAAVLITMPWDEIEGFDNLENVSAQMSCSDGMTEDDMQSVIMTYGFLFMKRKGMFQ